MDISSRHFKIYFQKLNTKVLKFIKILSFNIKEDDYNDFNKQCRDFFLLTKIELNIDPNISQNDISCIVESRSLSLEYISLQKLRTVYQDFLATFPTTYLDDIQLMKNKRESLTHREYFAIVYRSELKKIIINQIRLVEVVIQILERIMKGMTFDFAVTRVFELESKKEFFVNRIMIDS